MWFFGKKKVVVEPEIDVKINTDISLERVKGRIKNLETNLKKRAADSPDRPQLEAALKKYKLLLAAKEA